MSFFEETRYRSAEGERSARTAHGHSDGREEKRVMIESLSSLVVDLRRLRLRQPKQTPAAGNKNADTDYNKNQTLLTLLHTMSLVDYTYSQLNGGKDD